MSHLCIKSNLQRKSLNISIGSKAHPCCRGSSNPRLDQKPMLLDLSRLVGRPELLRQNKSRQLAQPGCMALRAPQHVWHFSGGSRLAPQPSSRAIKRPSASSITTCGTRSILRALRAARSSMRILLMSATLYLADQGDLALLGRARHQSPVGGTGRPWWDCSLAWVQACRYSARS